MFPCQSSLDDSAKKLIPILTDLLAVLMYVGKDAFAGTFQKKIFTWSFLVWGFSSGVNDLHGLKGLIWEILIIGH